jgi:hypothetical protein
MVMIHWHTVLVNLSSHKFPGITIIKNSNNISRDYLQKLGAGEKL